MEPNKIFCIYGTKRDGLTWAAFYAKNLSQSLQRIKDESWERLLDLCQPYRNMISAGSRKFCIDSYVLNKEHEALQHHKILNSDEINQLRNMANKVHDCIEAKTQRELGVQPELLNMFFFERIPYHLVK